MLTFLIIASCIAAIVIGFVIYSIVTETIRISKAAYGIEEGQKYELRKVSKNPFEPDKVKTCIIREVLEDHCLISIENNSFVARYELKSMLKTEFIALGWKLVDGEVRNDN